MKVEEEEWGGEGRGGGNTKLVTIIIFVCSSRIIFKVSSHSPSG